MKNIPHRCRIFFLLFYFLLFISYLADAQPNKDKYRDKVWVFGGYSPVLMVGRGNCTLTFNDNLTTDTTRTYSTMSISAVSSSLCDTLGNLVCYTNGIYITDKTHQKMINGDSLDYGSLWEDYRNLGQPYFQCGVTFLPVNGKKECAVMIYPNTYEFPVTTYKSKGLNAAFIDLKRNNGKGIVIQKDIPILLEDSLGGLLATACRHANGRDWWYISPRYGLNKYYKTLFSPYGIQIFPPQIMPRANNFVNFYGQAIMACFSSDGKRYAHHNPQIGTYLYDFDRCTGMLSNRRLIPLFRAYRTPFCGIAFSPNSRYLYVTDDSQIAQYDLQAPNVPASNIIVADYDGFQDSLGGNTAFFLLQLAPNGKIYGACTGGNHYLHIIHNPNERGLACNVEQHGLRLPTMYDSTMPNFPNFRLGSEPGTICDSLGIETGVTNPTAASPNPSQGGELSQISVSPNPTSGESIVSLQASLFEGQKGVMRLFSVDGKILEIFTNPFLSQSNITINLKNYAKGVYIIEYENSDGIKARGKVVRQ